MNLGAAEAFSRSTPISASNWTRCGNTETGCRNLEGLCFLSAAYSPAESSLFGRRNASSCRNWSSRCFAAFHTSPKCSSLKGFSLWSPLGFCCTIESYGTGRTLLFLNSSSGALQALAKNPASIYLANYSWISSASVSPFLSCASPTLGAFFISCTLFFKYCSVNRRISFFCFWNYSSSLFIYKWSFDV